LKKTPRLFFRFVILIKYYLGFFFSIKLNSSEWLYAKHSVSYSKLPSYFIAFDMFLFYLTVFSFDKTENKFFSVEKRNEILKDSGIPIIKTVEFGKFSEDDYIKILKRKSFYDQNNYNEGIYLRIDDGDYLKLRAKIVREEFIQQISTHWSSKNIEKNIIDFEETYKFE
jgi:hypothetical protein